MRVLSCLYRTYYGDPNAVNPFYFYFVDLLRQMGHSVAFFDHYEQATLNKDAMNDSFLALLRGGGYDCVLVESVADEFYPEVLEEAKKYSQTVAFNSDDDFRWLEYSAKWAPYFSFVVTTYRHIYEKFRKDAPNLLLSAWACGGSYNGMNVAKDIPVSFVGGIHADRAHRIESLRKYVPIETYGKGSHASQATFAAFRKSLFHYANEKLRGRSGSGTALRNLLLLKLGAQSDGINFAQVNALWNRSRISFTPLNLSDAQFAQKLALAKAVGEAKKSDAWSPWASPMQIKGRVFELGYSGTLLLCDRNPAIDEFYERGKEYEDFESSDECVDKIRFYLDHEDARAKIALAYYERTKREHLWERRLTNMFTQIGL